MNHTVTNEEVKQYKAMVEKFLRDSVLKNWQEGRLKNKGNSEASLGNTGMSVEDFRQYLMTEVVVALQKYNPEYKTKEGKSVKPSTFVFCHLNNRIGGLLKRLCKKRRGYGIWTSRLEDVLNGSKESYE
jgi:hypothetical protein